MRHLTFAVLSALLVSSLAIASGCDRGAGTERRADPVSPSTTKSAEPPAASASVTGQSAGRVAAARPMRIDVERTTATCADKAVCEADCVATKPGACAKLSRLLEPLRTDAATAKHAVELVQASCLAGDAKACEEFAGYLEAGIFVKRDVPRATSLWGEAAKAFRSACAHGDHVACRGTDSRRSSALFSRRR